MTIGDIIKQYRTDSKISMEEFAQKCTLSKGYISMLEKNINPRNNKPIVPTLTSLNKIALGLGIDVDTLLNSLDSNQKISIATETDSLSKTELSILDDFRLLNKVGQQEAVKRVNELTCIPQYQKKSEVPVLKAAHARTDIEITPEMQKHDDDIMEDDSEWE